MIFEPFEKMFIFNIFFQTLSIAAYVQYEIVRKFIVCLLSERIPVENNRKIIGHVIRKRPAPFPKPVPGTPVRSWTGIAPASPLAPKSSCSCHGLRQGRFSKAEKMLRRNPLKTMRQHNSKIERAKKFNQKIWSMVILHTKKGQPALGAGTG